MTNRILHSRDHAAVEPVRLGIVGCGYICPTYLRTLRTLRIVEVLACADVLLDRAEAVTKEFGVPIACSVEDLLTNPEIEIVVNLTPPRLHSEIAHKAIQAGKSVYNEKPLAVLFPEGESLLQEAKTRGLRVGCAPDTFLGGGLQTCRKVIDDGWIGRPVAASAFMVCHGHEDWHPNVDFYYQPGGGPLLDMGPYYLTALTTILGPIRRVTGFTAMGFKERETQLPGGLTRTINVNTPTHIVAGLEFHSGVIATLVTSFDVWASELPRIEVYGAEGTLSLPDPDVFSGPVRIIRARQAQWSEMPLVHGYAEESRGIGIADMAYGIRLGRPHRASGDLALHVLEVMLGIQASALTGEHVAMTTTCQLPEPLPTGSGEHRLVH